jgi:hypothetical protein
MERLLTNNPAPSAEEVLHGSCSQLYCPGRGADKDWALEVSNIPKKNQEAARRWLLVLQGECRHDPVTRPATLLKFENEHGQDGSLGREGPRRTARPPGQPQVGKEIAEVSGTLRGRKNGG